MTMNSTRVWLLGDLLLALRTAVLWLLALTTLVAGSALPAECQAENPIADPKAVVVSGQARFTVLTPQLIRMEWAAGSQFEDHASLVFLNRRLAVPSHSVKDDQGWLILQTDALTLRYKTGSGKFTAENLEVSFSLQGKPVVWRPGMEDKGNLGGTIRTLDGVKGATALEPGLLSRDGWVVVDDTERPLFDGSDWPWVLPRPLVERQDWYFFGYGHDYRKALQDFTRVAGKIPIPPRFAFGFWWSRYWAYTDEEFKQLVREFEIHDVPLDVLVIDMDWHPTFGVKWWENRKDQAGQRLGWTGYTWNRLFFPDPAGFLAWTDRKGLKTPLNLHPASGVQPHEEKYPEMARAMGIDPATQQYVPFDIASKKFAENYLKILHHPLEKQGVDFWWLDWQQEHKTSLAGVTPTWWLNYVHFTDMERQGKRPILMHRWGGLGNHRYQIGFSGDTISVWESLAFQPYFTATAANVGYGYWSHDIGGHMPGNVSPELYTRWIQFGVFSPILRTHTTKNPQSERRIWAYPPDFFYAMREAVLLRYALIPYVYTAARQAYDSGVALCRPMYHDYPDAEEAYEFKDQYLFGDDLIVAPIAAPASQDTGLATQKIWLPEGNWFEWFTGERLKGPARVEREYALGEIPAFAKAGAVIPLQPKVRHTGEKPVDPLILLIVPGESGTGRVYEDDGNTPGYKRGEFAQMTVRHATLRDGTRKIEILPVEGGFPGMLKERAYELRLPGTWPPESVTYKGKPVPFSREPVAPGWQYEGETLTTIIRLPRSSTARPIEVLIKEARRESSQAARLEGLPRKLARLKRAMEILNTSWPKGWSPDILIEAVGTGNRISIQPANALEELTKLQQSLPQIIEQVEKMDVDRKSVDLALAQLKTLLRP